MKIVAMGDLHSRVTEPEVTKKLIARIPANADVLLVAGDITDTGLPQEAEIAAKALKSLKMPVIAVLGNHDHEKDQAELIAHILGASGICLLDATVHEIGNVGFVGTKGFCGGFGSAMIQPFGERALKTFLQTSIDEAVRLENALARMQDCEHKVALLHYSPIRETLVGEQPELFAFLGSGRLANALDRQVVDVIFHGHAHHGSPFGITLGKIPVYNVSRFVMQQVSEQPFCLYTI